MKARRSHPRHGLDSVIHAPVRLSIMSALACVESIDFKLLRDTLEVSDSLLSKHISVLEEAGYVEVTKGYVRKRPRTWFALTDEGRAAFQQYVTALRKIVQPDGGELGRRALEVEPATQPAL